MPRSLADLFERGTPVGDWSLICPLDKNLAASLWVAHCGNRVAYLRSFRVRSLRTAKRLKQVVDWAAAYEHNSILPHLDLPELDGGGGHAVVSHYEEGQLLASMLSKATLARKPVPPPVAASIAIDLLDALVATGGRLAPAWAHGGLRPESILITRGGRARIMELGAAGVMGAVDPLARDVRWAGYASPEQIETGKPGSNSDVFSLAVLLWEMLVNRPAFNERSYTELKPKLLDADIDRADKRASTRVPTALADVVAQALAREPEERFETPKAFAGAIRAASAAVAERHEVAETLERLHQAVLNVRRRTLEQALGRPAPTSIAPPAREGAPRAAVRLVPSTAPLPKLDPPSSPSATPSSPAPSSPAKASPAKASPAPAVRSAPPPRSTPPASSAPGPAAVGSPTSVPSPALVPRPDSVIPPPSSPLAQATPPPPADAVPVPLTRRSGDSLPPADDDPPDELPDEPATLEDQPSAGAATEQDHEATDVEETPTSPAAPASNEAASETDHESPVPASGPSESDSDVELSWEDASPSENAPTDVTEQPPTPEATTSEDMAIEVDQELPDDEPGPSDDSGPEVERDEQVPIAAPKGAAPTVEQASGPATTLTAKSSDSPVIAPAFDPEALLADTSLDGIDMRPPRRWPTLLLGMALGSGITLALVVGTADPAGETCADAGAPTVPEGTPSTVAPAPAAPAASLEPEPQPSATASASATAKPKKRPKRRSKRPRKPATKPAPPPPPPPPPPKSDGPDIYD